MAKTVRLGDFCEKIGSGATPRGGKEAYSENGPVTLIRSLNVYNDRFSYSGLARISVELAEELRNVEVRPADILLNITGDSVARVCQVSNDVLPARVNQHVAIIRPKPSEIDARFLRYFLVSPSMQAHMLGLAAAGATRNALTKSMIEDFRIPALHIDKQHAISAVLGALDDKIELNRRMNETLEAMARALFKDWFVDFGPTRAKIERRTPYLAPEIWSLFPECLDEHSKPQRWQKAKLGDIAQQVGVNVSPETLEPDTPYIGLEHMPRRSIALSEWEGAEKVTSGKLAFHKGDFLFGKLRPYFHKVGLAPVDGICSTDIVVLNARESKAAGFILMCISQDEFVAFADRTSDGTKMPRTSWDRMERYDFCLPNGAVLDAFNTCIEPMLERIVSNIHESHTLAATRDLLLPKLMSGEIRVKDAEKIVREAT